MSEEMIKKEAIQCCGNCRWHDVEGLYKMYGENADGMGDIGFCRRRPPLPGQWRVPTDDPHAARIDYFMFADWPETSEEDFCGEWEESKNLEREEKPEVFVSIEQNVQEHPASEL